MASRQLVDCAGAPAGLVLDGRDGDGLAVLAVVGERGERAGHGQRCRSGGTQQVAQRFMSIFGAFRRPAVCGSRASTASTTFWMPQKSSWAAEANVTVLMEL